MLFTADFGVTCDVSPDTRAFFFFRTVEVGDNKFFEGGRDGVGCNHSCWFVSFFFTLINRCECVI